MPENTFHNRFGNFRSGFVAIIGAPNAGKSTLMNRLVGEKVSITSQKAQTTRNRIMGVMHLQDAQVVFLDTPGIHQTNAVLNRRMVDIALSAITEADLVLLLADISRRDAPAEEYALAKLATVSTPIILVLNKTDKVDKKFVPEQKEQWAGSFDFHRIFPVSAKYGDGLDALVNEMSSLLPSGPPYFPEDALTDMPERFIAAEMIREKVFRLTGQELPYSCAVTVEHFSEDKEKNLVRIHATIHMERETQKPMVIGKGGKMLKKIGTAAREDMEKLLGIRVFLKLFVRVEKNWSKDTKALRRLGYE